MLINSALNEGLAGMQQSQRRMLQAAEDIVKAGMPTDRSLPNNASTAVATTNNGTAAQDLPPGQSIEALDEAERPSLSRSGQGDIVEPLIEQKRQQLLFDASANVVKAANETIGSLIDDLS